MSEEQAAESGFPERMRRIESLVAELEECADPATQARSRALVQAVLELHGAGLARLLQLASEHGEAGRVLAESFLRDELLASLLLLHDLHPHDLAARAGAALDRVRAQLGAQGCRVELIEAAGGRIRVRMERTTRTHGTSAEGLRAAVLEALSAAVPDAEAIEVEGAIEPLLEAPLVQLHVPAAAGARSGGPP
ncbi:MAG: NifU family protein [Steroidobacteraceae bacterium]